MNNKSGKSIISIDGTRSQPIYRQIINSIHQALSDGRLRNGDLLPSVNYIAAECSVARGSIFKAYNELRSTGVIDSIPGKGYFVTNTNHQAQLNVFLLLSTFNPYREVLFNAFVDSVGSRANVDLYFHHHNIDVFETLIHNHAAYYNCFILMPEIHNRTKGIFNKLDPRRLFILDMGLKEFGDKYPCVGQNHEKDIFNFLETHKERVKRYKRVILLFPENIRTFDVITGFKNFFKKHSHPSKVVKKTSGFKYEKSDLCITMDDKDLVRLIKVANQNNWMLGKDIGVISYNETPLKSVIAGGITTITTDFEKMGMTMADMVLNNKREHVENPFLMIERNSF
jgi:DNA-binding transcriptional regulator YhcF (GntR family)